MFTIYIHIFEVLASFSEGATVRKIVEMGSEYTRAQISAKLRALEEEGYVIADRSGKTIVYQMTDKAIEYFETVTRKYAASHVMDEIADYVASVEVVKSTIQELSEVPASELDDEKPSKYTPREMLVIHAAHRMLKYNITSDRAIESVIMSWIEQNGYEASRDYYHGLSHNGMLKLITDVKNYRPQIGG